MHNGYNVKKAVILAALAGTIFLAVGFFQGAALFLSKEASCDTGVKGNDGRKTDTSVNKADISVVEMEDYSGGSKEVLNVSYADTHIIKNVPHIWQLEDYPTGCESVAAVSLMNYFGMDITVDAFIDGYLKCSGEPCYEEGILVGESPWESFLGNPRSVYGFGCYATVIERASNEYMEACTDGEYVLRVIYDMDLNELCENYVSHDIPVMVWATIDMMEPYQGDRWQLPAGSIFTFICPEHALLLIGYDDEYYYFSDSMADEAVVSYKKEACEAAYAGLYRQAIVISPMNDEKTVLY